jgi:hypothetical protein
LFERARKMSQGFESFRIEHVYREQNREADALANEALDETGGPAAKSPAPSKPQPPKSVAPPRVKARYQSGVLYPLEDVNLADGTVVEVSIHPLPKQ